MRFSIIICLFIFAASCDSKNEKIENKNVDSILTAVKNVDTVLTAIEKQNEVESEEVKISSQGLISEIIPKGFSVTSKVFGYLDEDTLQDCAIIINRYSQTIENILLVLIKNEDSTYKVSLNTSGYLSIDNEIEIQNRKLMISNGSPSQGYNRTHYEFELKNNEWLCNNASSNDFEDIYDWSTKMNFVTGEFNISQTITVFDTITKSKKIKGKLSVSHPVLIGEISKYCEVEQDNKSYRLLDRNNLWTENEVKNLSSVGSDK